MIKSNRGQLSIFMGITLIIVMSMLAFIINVGLFVKAKINLQNATDAAAFSGAATQARQLTNIAYANWELRNTYKEWMFKYYVLGQLGLFPYNLQKDNINGKQTLNFILPTPAVAGITDFDKYNIPSICIHNNSKTNICPLYALPGIPRFPAIGVAGISEIHEAFVNQLVEEKGKDCSRRSKANFLTALTWAYGSGSDKNPMPEAPLVATNRPGAWPQALELALRIRNLEMIVNRPPVAEITRQNITQLDGQASEIGLNERPIKAFWSAYRNLGGGAYKDCATKSGTGSDCTPDELSYNLKLTELAPQPFSAPPTSVSGFLIPDDFTYPVVGGGKANQKHYLDLQLMPVNLATMFSTFVDRNAENASNGIGALSEAACGVSKTALPVPGYIMGFNKNPNVLTYYAVKAESKFIGLFLPLNIGDGKGIKLTAYAAAKPFGGRIGPKLFTFTNDGTVVARNDTNHRSAPYINGLQVEVGSAAGFKPGMPIPSSSKFWVSDTNPVIGGVPGTGTPIYYGIPNMIYDFDDEGDLLKQNSGGGGALGVQLIRPKAFAGALASEKLGLYQAPQFRALKDSIGIVNPGTSMSGQDVLKSIVRARRPTKYDVINYLVPDFKVRNDANAAAMIRKRELVSDVGFLYHLFAPLVGPNLLYKNANQVEIVVTQYMNANDQAVDTYLESLLAVANSIYNLPTQGDTNKQAARSIHVNAGTTDAQPAQLIAAPATDPGCKQDIASKFNHFFRKSFTGCEIVPLRKLMIDFIANASSTADSALFYTGTYYDEPTRPKLNLAPEQLMTAYYPGVRQGTTAQGIADHPLKLNTAGNKSYSTKRNFYSTKFVQLASILDNDHLKRYIEQPSLRESAVNWPDDLNGSTLLENPIKYSDVGNNSYFLDF